MAKTYLETNRVNYNFDDDNFERTKTALEKSGQTDELELLKAHPDSFPFLHAIQRRDTEEGASFSYREVPADTPEIVPESADVAPKDTTLELVCDLDGVGRFSISTEPYDRAGEDEPQMRAKIDFPNQTIDDLNAVRFKKIMEFCAQHGISVWDMDMPYKDGVIDLDEKLATLTQDYLLSKQQESLANAGPSVDNTDENAFQMIIPQIDSLTLPTNSVTAKAKTSAPKKQKDLADLRDDMINMLEKDLHRTKGKTYFEQKQRIDGRKTYIFSLYEKPDPDNLKNDGRRDKNDIPVPTYQYRLFISQDTKTGKFYFGIATPGGKKIDDAMAGDFMGIIKGTGATHVNFSNFTNQDKGVWLTACAEKGLIPIGIKIDLPKARKMVAAAKEKLTTEDLIIFKRRLAEQMIKNAKEKTKGSNDPSLGLAKSEWAYIESLRSAYDFENFRLAYEADDGLYALTLEQIDKGSRDEKEGAATTFGGMQALRTVFDIYNNYQSQTFGEYLNNQPKVGNMVLTPQERQKLAAGIPAGKKMTALNSADFKLIYETILPRHIEQAKKEIVTALEREDNRKGPKRASSVVLSSDLFPKYKGAVNEINIILTRNKGLDPLTLPTEHKGLEFLRQDPNAQNQNTPAKTPQAQAQPQAQQSASQPQANPAQNASTPAPQAEKAELPVKNPSLQKHSSQALR